MVIAVVFALRKEAREGFRKQKKGAARRGRPRPGNTFTD